MEPYALELYLGIFYAKQSVRICQTLSADAWRGVNCTSEPSEHVRERKLWQARPPVVVHKRHSLAVPFVTRARERLALTSYTGYKGTSSFKYTAQVQCCTLGVGSTTKETCPDEIGENVSLFFFNFSSSLHSFRSTMARSNGSPGGGKKNIKR